MPDSIDSDRVSSDSEGLEAVAELQQDFQDILLSLRKIDLLYHQKKNAEAKDAISDLLEANTGKDAQEYISQIIQDIQSESVLSVERHPDADAYGDFYNHKLYQQLVPYCELAYLTEGVGIAKEHALKLSVAFKRTSLSPKAKDSALKYIIDNLDNNKYALHDACLFVLPNVLQCNFSEWKEKIPSNLNDEDFRHLLANAENLDELIEVKSQQYGRLKIDNQNIVKQVKEELKQVKKETALFQLRNGEVAEEYKAAKMRLAELELEQRLMELPSSSGEKMTKAEEKKLKNEVGQNKKARTGVKKTIAELERKYDILNWIQGHKDYLQLQEQLQAEGDDIESIELLKDRMSGLEESHAPLTENEMQLQQRQDNLEHKLIASQQWLQTLKDETKGKEQEISKVKKQLKPLKSRHGDLYEDEAVIYTELNQALSRLYIELYEMSVIKDFRSCSIHQLKSMHEHLIISHDNIYSYMLKNGLVQIDYERFKELQRQNDDDIIPNLTVESDELEESAIYLMKVDVMEDWQAARACCFGKLTHCCQSLSGEAGQPCVIHGLTSPNGGFYVLCRGDANNPQQDDEVLAQCWAWRSKNNAIVFDSIETSGSADEGTVKFMYNKLAEEMVDREYTHKVACGAGSGLRLGISNHEREQFKDYTDYCDSRKQNILCYKDKPYLFYDSRGSEKDRTHVILDSIMASEAPLAMSKFLWGILTWNSFNEEASHQLISIMEIKATEHSREKEFVDIHNAFNEHFNSIRVGDETLQAIECRVLSVNFRNKNGDTPLMLAAKNGEAKAVQVLLALGADPDLKKRDGNTALMLAAIYGHTDIVLALITINAKDKDGQTALMLAAKYGHKDTALALIERGADINAKDEVGQTALMLAAENGKAEVVQALLASGADVDAKDNHGHTALMLVARYGQKDTALALIEKGADVNAKDKDGQTALMLAVKERNGDIVLALIEGGGEVDILDGEDRTALMTAISIRNSRHALTLIDNGASLDYQNQAGQTALFFATKNKNTYMIMELMERGAKSDILDKKGHTALDLIDTDEYRETVEGIIEGSIRETVKVQEQSGKRPRRSR